MCRGLEARQALEAGEAAAAPAFARPRAPRQGPPPATPHSPSARSPARACPGCRVSRSPPRALLLWDSALSGSPPLFSSPGPSSPGPAACLSTLRLYLLRDRAVEAPAVSSSERRGSATLSRRRHYALRRGTARGWRAAVSAGGDAASVRSEDTLPLSVRPGKSSRAGARRERAGGRPRGEGSRGRRNGCHVARWISAPAPGPRPLPLHTPTPGSPGCVGPRHGAGPETRAHRCWRLAGSVKRSESRAWREAQPKTRGPRGSPGSLRPVVRPREPGGKAGAGPFAVTRGPLLLPV